MKKEKLENYLVGLTINVLFWGTLFFLAYLESLIK